MLVVNFHHRNPYQCNTLMRTYNVFFFYFFYVKTFIWNFNYNLYKNERQTENKLHS